MKVLIIGGTGLLGSEAAKQFIEKGYEVTCIALPPLPYGANLPEEMKVVLGNFITMGDEELSEHIKGCDGLVFAAGIDERVEGPAPIYDVFKKFNIDALERLMTISLKCGVKKTVICGSYFSYFDKIQQSKQLTKWHPYIRSRRDQEAMALSFVNQGMDVGILELPYIFGAQPGRKPVWTILTKLIKRMKLVTFYPKGGTTMVTVRQVGQAIVGGMEKNRGGNTYPIGYYNMTWVEMLAIVHKYMGLPKRKVITIPNFLFAITGKLLMIKQKIVGLEGGLDLVKYTSLMCEELYIDKSLGCDILGVTEDNIDQAIGESINLCLEIMNNKTVTVDMRGE